MSTSPVNPLSTVTSRKAFFDSLLDDGVDVEKPSASSGQSPSPAKNWTTFD
jgi:hypothetical protein